VDLTHEPGPGADDDLGRLRTTDDIERAVAILQARDPGADPTFGSREQWALGTLYETYFALAWRTAARLLACRAEVEDVVEDVFVRLPATIRRYRPGNFAGWLREVVQCAALMRLRAASRQREDALDCCRDIAGEAVGEADLITLEDAAAVRRALDELPDSLRAVVMLRVYDDLPHGQIGALLGITTGASEVRYSRALCRLRHLLRGHTSS
jgi:RNA polymerase sigma-70 factor (ECF subfamily)